MAKAKGMATAKGKATATPARTAQPKRKRKRGQPTRFDAAFIAVAKRACAGEGLTDARLANLFGVTRNTIERWKKAHEEFDQAVREGKEIYDCGPVEAALRKSAIGYDVIEETRALVEGTGGKGELAVVKEVTKHIPANPTSAIFHLKNRNPERWKDRKGTLLESDASDGFHLTIRRHVPEELPLFDALAELAGEEGSDG